MAVGRRAQRRTQMLRIGYVVAAVLIVLTLLFAVNASWIWAIIFGAAAAAAVWYVRQVRALR